MSNEGGQGARIKLSIRATDKKGIRTSGFAYNGITVRMSGGKGSFEAEPNVTRLLEWAMVGDPGGSMKVEVLREGAAIYTREKSEIVQPYSKAVDAFEIKVS